MYKPHIFIVFLPKARVRHARWQYHPGLCSAQGSAFYIHPSGDANRRRLVGKLAGVAGSRRPAAPAPSGIFF